MERENGDDSRLKSLPAIRDNARERDYVSVDNRVGAKRGGFVSTLSLCFHEELTSVCP